MDRFLGRSAFAGPAIDAHAAASRFAGQARFSGCIAFTNWPRDEVAALLPPELTLAPNGTAPDVHPVMFVFGDQADGALIFGGLTVPTQITYQELGIVVPFVQHGGGPHLHNWVPRMYSSYFPAVWHGNAHYGFAKELARMRWHGPIFLATREEGSLLMHADTEPSGDWSPGTRCDAPNFDAMRAIVALPVLGRRDDGTYVRSYFGWDFRDATVRPSDSCVSIDVPVIAGLRPRRCHDTASGTFEVRGMTWRLSWPSTVRR
jgi:hypothetical protein